MTRGEQGEIITRIEEESQEEEIPERAEINGGKNTESAKKKE